MPTVVSNPMQKCGDMKDWKEYISYLLPTKWTLNSASAGKCSCLKRYSHCSGRPLSALVYPPVFHFPRSFSFLSGMPPHRIVADYRYWMISRWCESPVRNEQLEKKNNCKRKKRLTSATMAFILSNISCTRWICPLKRKSSLRTNGNCSMNMNRGPAAIGRA